VGRRGLALLAATAALGAAAMAAAQDGSRLSVAKDIVRHGDDIELIYHIGRPDFPYRLSLDRQGESKRNPAYYKVEQPPQLPGTDGRWRLSSRYVAFPQGTLDGSASDIGRAILQGHLARDVSASGWLVTPSPKILVLREVAPQPGAIVTAGRKSWRPGQPIEVQINPKPLPASLSGDVESVSDTDRLQLQLHRLGEVVPGGAVQPDRMVASHNFQKGERGARFDGVTAGRYELRLVVSDFNALLDRVPVDVMDAESAKQSLQVSGDGTASVTLRTNLPPESRHAFLRVFRLGDDGEPRLLSNAPSRSVANGEAVALRVLAPPAPTRGGPIVVPPPAMEGDLPAGAYEARLYDGGELTVGGSIGIANPLGKLDEAVALRIIGTASFRLGVSPTAARPPAGKPAATLRLATPRVPIDAELKAEVAGLTAGTQAWVALYRKPVTSDIGVRHESVRIGNPMAAGAALTMRAPAYPGVYELRLYRGDLPGGDGQRDFPDAELLSRAALEVTVSPLAKVLRLSTGPVVEVGDENVDLVVEVPKARFRKGMEIAVASASDIMPGGIVRMPETFALRRAELGACYVRLRLKPFTVPGNYEVRLYDRPTNDPYAKQYFGVSLLRFAVVDSEAPVPPAGSEPRLADLSDWPKSQALDGPGDRDDRDEECREKLKRQVAQGGRWAKDGP
jgi:hypothetical protein